ncbi:MAG: hypothetical protein AABX77_03765 [Nanoarchaeota archaeon]
MKSSAAGWELFIKLSKNEISLLQKQSLNGEINVYDIERERKIGSFPLELKLAELNQHQLYLELITNPKRVYFDEVKEWIVKVSKEGYEKLIKYDQIGDRMYSNPGCTIIVKKDDASL